MRGLNKRSIREDSLIILRSLKKPRKIGTLQDSNQLSTDLRYLLLSTGLRLTMTLTLRQEYRQKRYSRLKTPQTTNSSSLSVRLLTPFLELVMPMLSSSSRFTMQLYSTNKTGQSLSSVVSSPSSIQCGFSLTFL